MTSTPDPVTLALTGQLPFILIAGALLALPVSLFLLWLYRRAVIRGMRRRTEGGGDTEAAVPVLPQDDELPVSGDFRLEVMEKVRGKDLGKEKRGFFGRARYGPWQAAAVYAVAGGLFAAVMAAAFLLSTETPFLPLRFLTLFWMYAWPLVLTLALVAGSSRPVKIALAAGYFLVLVVLGAAALARSPELTVAQLAILWASTNVPPTVLFMIFLLRRVRAVGPLVVAFMTVALTGSVAFLAVGGMYEGILRSMAELGFSVGLGATGVFLAMILVGLLLFAVLGWFALLWIRREYRAKRISDQSLVLDALWLLFGVTYSVRLVFEEAWWILAAPAAFLSYLLTVRIGFVLIKAPQRAQKRNLRLLLLRVFSLGRRSERLFDVLSGHWRYIGNIQLIAGPDLVASTVEPHEFLDFVSGRLRRQFIASREVLDRRLAELDTGPDFDGRYRVNDFFCQDDTWRLTLKRLVAESDAVFMDLRGFSPRNAGCVYELHALVNAAPMQKVILAADETTDLPFLEKTLADAFRSMQADSPNRGAEAKTVRAVRLERDEGGSLMSLLRGLCLAAETSSSGDFDTGRAFGLGGVQQERGKG